MINIAELLKICPKGTKLYSPICGEVTLESVCLEEEYPIYVSITSSSVIAFTKDGKYFNRADAECILFPSKDNRYWSTFVPPCGIKPYDKVVVRRKHSAWYVDFFLFYNSDYVNDDDMGKKYSECLPYNEETAKLIGTTDDYNG